MRQPRGTPPLLLSPPAAAAAAALDLQPSSPLGWSQVDLETVDVMLVTHFHLDHCAAMPYVVGHTNFKARHGQAYRD